MRMKAFHFLYAALVGLSLSSIVEAQDKSSEYLDASPRAMLPTKTEKCNGNPSCEKYDSVHSLHNDRRVVKLNQLYGYVDGNGNEIVSPQYLSAKPFQNSDYAVVTRRHGKKHMRSGLINRNGEIVIPLEYGALGQCRENRIWVGIKDKGGFFDCQGQEIIPLKYERLLAFNEGVGGYYDKKGLVYIDPDGRPIFGESRFENGGNFRNGRALVQKDGNWHFIDRAGNSVTNALNIDGIGKYENGLYSVRRNGLYGRMNDRGEWVIPPEYDRLRYQNLHVIRDGEPSKDSTLIFALKANKWGLLDIRGNTILPVIFNDIDAYGFLDDYGVGEPLIRVHNENDALYYYNRKGERVQPRTRINRPWASQNGGWTFRTR